MATTAVRRLRFDAYLAAALLSIAGFSPAAHAIRLNGLVSVQSSDGGGGEVQFSCEGENPCRGEWVATMKTPDCSNNYGRLGTMSITGLSLSTPGPIAGTLTVDGIQNDSVTRHLDGSCAVQANATTPFITAFTGAWSGTTATLVFPTASGGGATLNVTGGFALVSQLVQVSGSVSGSGTVPGSGFGNMQLSFTCEGENPCMGTATLVGRDPGCSNTFTMTDKFGMMGLNLSQPGNLYGGLVLKGGGYYTLYNPDGSCGIKPGRPDGGARFTGTWNGSSGTLTLIDQDYPTSGSFTASITPLATGTPPPVFPMTVTADIGPTVSSASANIQYRPQDVGSTGSVFVFAVAPSSLVKVATDGTAPFVVGKSTGTGPAKADSVACVLAQLNSAGQLQAVSASSIQAYVTGVLSSQGQAVTIINGVPTASIGGATFYVGYGASSSAMINNGINRSAVTVPASRVCKPQPPQTGWWWNPAEGGRGYSIEAQGNNLFMATYLYDVSGRATWYVAAGPTSLDGSLFNGQLLSFGGGVALTGAYRANNRLPDAGAITLAFDDAQHGTLVWPGGTVALQRYEFGANGTGTEPLGNQPESGWWWGGAADNGRGFFIEWQGARAFVAGYMYDAQGNAMWYVADSPVAGAQAFTSSWLQFANGQALTGTYRAPSLVNGNVAPVTIQFQGTGNALITLPSGTLPITRFRF